MGFAGLDDSARHGCELALGGSVPEFADVDLPARRLSISSCLIGKVNSSSVLPS